VPPRSHGKVVDVWKWQRDDDKLIDVPLRLAKRSSHYDQNEGETTGTMFVVIMDSPKFELAGTDCEALRLAVWEKLDKAHEIKWSWYLRVKVERPAVYDAIGNGLVVSWDRVEKGVAWTGAELLREREHFGAYSTVVSPWPGTFTDKRGTVIACIPAHKANERGLEEFSRRIDKLREFIAEFLKPENIERALQNIGRLLPEPQRPPT
jgi:hypothetical protein